MAGAKSAAAGATQLSASAFLIGGAASPLKLVSWDSLREQRSFMADGGHRTISPASLSTASFTSGRSPTSTRAGDTARKGFDGAMQPYWPLVSGGAHPLWLRRPATFPAGRDA